MKEAKDLMQISIFPDTLNYVCSTGRGLGVGSPGRRSSHMNPSLNGVMGKGVGCCINLSMYLEWDS